MNLEQKIAAASAQQRNEAWAARQEAAKRQQTDEISQRAERFRSQRIEQLRAALDGIPARRKAFEQRDAEAGELSAIFSTSVDAMANAYATRIHAERQQGRSIRLELGSEGAMAFFFGSEIKKGLRQLALIANQRSFGAPLIDPESFASELKAEEQRLRGELAELQLRG